MPNIQDVQKTGPGTYRCGMYTITHQPKPIPHRGFDWNWVHDDYDGPGDKRAGTASSLEDALEEIGWAEEDAEGALPPADLDRPRLESLEVLANSDPEIFAEAVKKYGLQVIGTRESDPLQTQVQEELVSAMASAITEDINDNTELTAMQQAIYQLAEQYGYIVHVIE